MKLTFEHGLDGFRWSNSQQPAPGKSHRDLGVCFWLNGELVESVRKDFYNHSAEEREAAENFSTALNDWIVSDGMTSAQIRDEIQAGRLPLPSGITLD